MKITTVLLETIDSTNTEALKQARLGADEGLCIVAREQTAGRGRQGRKWRSEKDAGLCYSIVLRPRIDLKLLPLITLMAGVAVYDTMEELGLRPDIKWVNDILINEKKICGILAESTETEKGLAVIVGIGINLEPSNFPPEMADTAISIEECSADSAQAIRPASLAEALTTHITYFYDIIHGENGPARIIKEWRRRSSYFSGKPVRVVLENQSLEGLTEGLEPNGALRVRRNDGTLEIVQAGDVQQLRTTLDAQTLGNSPGHL